MKNRALRVIVALISVVLVAELLGMAALAPTASFVAPQSAEAQQGASCGFGLWDTKYYPNTTLTPTQGQATYCVTNNQLNAGINWGSGSPLQGIVGTDYWSSSFEAQVTLGSAGTYQFTTTFQDGVRLYVNGQPIINNFGSDVGSAQTANGTYVAAAANTVVLVRLEHVNYTGNAQASLNWSLTTGGGGTPPTGQPWTAQYFNNRTFSGTPISGPSLPAGPLAIDWQFNAPAGGVVADGFSSRFTRVVNFPSGGVVNFEARGDDTVTVYVNGTPVTASAPYFAGEGVVYRGSITVPVGDSTIMVEHTDIVDQAYVFVSWTGGGDTSGGGTGDGGTGTPVVTSPTGVVATVNTSVLNFRDAPSTSGNRITQIRRGEQYAVLGQNADGTWAYLVVNGVQGWSSAQYLTFTGGDFASLQALNAAGQPITTNTSGDVVLLARPVGNMRIRECPSFSCTRLGFVPWGDTVSVFGLSLDGRWIKISYTGASGTPVIGWSSEIWYRVVGDLSQPLPSNLPIVE